MKVGGAISLPIYLKSVLTKYKENKTMSLVRKTYKLKVYARAQTYVNVKGKTVLVEFKSARRNDASKKGIFTTAIPELIEAIEKDSGFNKLYELALTEEIAVAAPEVIEVRANPLEVKKKLAEEELKHRQAIESKTVKGSEVVVDPVKGIESTDNASDKVENKGIVTIPSADVANVQQAKDWLKEKYPDLTFKQLTNKDAVLAIAKEKAVVFEALK
jgi:hypothetical protein